ncbi:MAG: hypothetical protein WBA12_08615, partial [Catalinimonas sp.]
MKKWFFLLLIGTALSAPAQAQDKELEKQEKKEWAKKLKDTDPLAFKAMVEQIEDLKIESAQLRETVTAKQREVDEATAATADLRAELAEAKA